MIELPDVLEVLSSRVDALEQRVRQLEDRSELPVVQAAPALPSTHDSAAGEETSQVSGVFPVLGKAMLGIAGAFVLRALAESTSLPRLAIAVLAIVYALAWLLAASRVAPAKSFAGAAYAATSALILAPMLWELTLRFHVLPATMTAGVLTAFVAVATGLAWKHDRPAVFSVAYGAAAATALVLSIFAHYMAPFTILLLMMVVVCEVASVVHRAQLIGPVVSVVGDVGIWSLIFVYQGAASTHSEYPPLPTALLLFLPVLFFLVGAAGIAVKTMLQGRKISLFEAAQGMVSFFLAACGIYFFADQSSALILGIGCLALSGACYAAVFGLFRHPAEPRNFKVFALWSAGLFLAGAFWSLTANWAAATLALAAVGITILGVRLGCRTLQFHGIIFLAASVWACGFMTYVFEALAGQMPSRHSWSLFVVAACAMFCYVAGRERPGEAWQEQVLHLVPASLAVCAAAALMASSIVGLAALRITPDVFHVAFIRTLTICSIALALAFGGSRWKRLEMTRIAYAGVAFVAAKLLFEDLRHGRMEFIAASIFLFAVTLICVPQLSRLGSRHQAH